MLVGKRGKLSFFKYFFFNPTNFKFVVLKSKLCLVSQKKKNIFILKPFSINWLLVKSSDFFKIGIEVLSNGNQEPILKELVVEPKKCCTYSSLMFINYFFVIILCLSTKMVGN